VKNIAILTGGDSEERVISLKSSAVVKRFLDKKKCRGYEIDIQGTVWRDLESGADIDKNDFSLKIGRKKVKFDAVFAALHGAPLENGQMQGYLEMLGLPYSCCDGFVSALTMNKAFTKTLLAPHGVPMAASFSFKKGDKIDLEKIATLGFPLFVKPNDHGSSFGVSKVKTAADLQKAIDFAFQFSENVMAEAFMKGREFANGVLRKNGKIVVLPITEIIPDDEFFTFEAKYEGRSQEITPAVLTPKQTALCQSWSKKIYEILDCKGFVRVDYILVGEIFQIIEVNTIPGMTDASLVPQQAVAAGISLSDFFNGIVKEMLK
jgi:D-alanine-D-alanine ligase